LRLQAQVVLQIGTDMPVPIPDLRVDDEGVYGTLSFKGVPFTCFLPWASIFAIVGEDSGGLVWNSEVPSEIRAEVDKDSKKASARKKPKALPPGVVSLEAARLTTPKSERTTPRKSDRPASERPAHLRLVK
jgi:stringent starvation protein B